MKKIQECYVSSKDGAVSGTVRELMRTAASLEFERRLSGFKEAGDSKAMIGWLDAVPVAAVEFYTRAAEVQELL